MAYEIDKIKTLSQYISGTKTELFPRTLTDAITDQDGVPLDDVIQGKIGDSLNDFVTGELNLSFVKKEDVYTKQEVDDKIENIDHSGFATIGQLSNKADKVHFHDELYAPIEHIHGEYIKRSDIEDIGEDIRYTITGDVLVDLNTLEKIAAAINNDTMFHKTIQNKIDEKLGRVDLDSILNDYTQIGHSHDDMYYRKSNLYTKTEIDTKLENLEIDVDLTSFATKNYVDEEIAEINSSFENYTTTEDLNTFLDGKVDKENGKQLSSEDFTLELKNKLEDIEENANFYEHPTKHDVSMIDGLHKVAISGTYSDLDETPESLSYFINDCDFVNKTYVDDSIKNNNLEIDSSIEDLDARIIANTELIESTKSDLQGKIDNITLNVTGELEDKIASNTELIESTKSELKSDISTLTNSVNVSIGELDERVTSNTDAIENNRIDIEGKLNQTDSSLKDLSQLLEEKVEELDEGIIANTELIESTKSDLQGKIDNITLNVTGELEDKIEQNTQLIESTKSELKSDISTLTSSVNKSIEELDERVTSNTDAIENNKLELDEDIVNLNKDLNTNITNIYGGETAKSELEGYGLESLLKIAASIDYNSDFKSYVDTEIEDAKGHADTEINKLKDSHKDDIDAIYGGEAAKEELESIGLSTIQMIANSIDNDPSFSLTVDQKIADLGSALSKDINDIYGDRTSLPNDLNSLSDIVDAIGGDSSYISNLATDLENMSSKHDSDIREIYGGEGAKSALTTYGLESLLKIAASIDYNPDFKSYVDEKVSSESDSSILEFEKTVKEIYGGDGAKETLVSHNLESLLKLAEAINKDESFYLTVQDDINTMGTETYNNSVKKIDEKIAELVDSAPELLDTLKELAEA